MEIERKNSNVDVYGMLRRPSCIIKIRDGRILVGIMETVNLDDMVFYCLSPFGCVIRLSNYLDGVYSVDYDVMKIYHTPTFSSINDSEEELEKYCVWNRDDNSVKNNEKVELTLDEIAAKFDIAIESLVIKK